MQQSNWARGLLIAFLAVVLVVTVALVLLTVQRDHRLTAAGSIPSTTGTPTTAPPETVSQQRAACLGAPDLVKDSGCSKVDLGSTIYPDPSVAASDTALQYDCYSQANAKVVACRFGSTAPDALRVAFVGDSHAASLLPGLLSQLQSAHWSLTTYLGDGCALSSSAVAQCGGAQQSIISSVTQNGAYDLVITTAARADGLSASSVAPVLARVIASGARLVVVADTPSVSQAALLCYTKDGYDPARTTCSTSRTRALTGADPLATAARQTPNAKVVDLTPYFCTSTACPSVIGNVVVYRDTSSGLTTTYSRTLGRYLVDQIRAKSGL